MLKSIKILSLIFVTLGTIGCGSGGSSSPSSNDINETEKDLTKLLTNKELFNYGGEATEYLVYNYSSQNTFSQKFKKIDDNSLIKEDTYSYSINNDILKYTSPTTDNEVTCELETSNNKSLELKCDELGSKYSEIYWYNLDDLKASI